MRDKLALVLLASWLTGSVLFAWVATVNFRTVDKLLGSPADKFAQILEPLSHAERRLALRHLVSELNRYFFRFWNLAQLALGAATLALVLDPGRRTPALLAAIMLALVLLSALFILPTIVTLGRNLDFVPRTAATPELRRFWLYHGLYVGLDLVKLALGLLLVFLLLKGR